MSRRSVVPRVPTLPKGEEIAAYDSYLEAQKAVDYLSDEKFAVQHVTIVGTDLRMVERVTGRLSYGRVALAGALSGAWFGFFVGLLLTLFAAGEPGVLLVALGLGAGFGLMFSVLSYAFTGGRRDFTSQSQIVASSYAILCAVEHAGEARRMLANSPSGLGKRRTPERTAPAAPSAPSAPDPRWTMPDGAPRYGAMRPGGAGSAASAGDAGAGDATGPDDGGSSTSSVAGGEGPSHPAPPSAPAPPNVDPDNPYAPPSDNPPR